MAKTNSPRFTQRLDRSHYLMCVAGRLEAISEDLSPFSPMDTTMRRSDRLA